MNKQTITPHPLMWLLEEHRELTRRITELRKWWSELDEFGKPKFGEMGNRVEELRNVLAEHFAEEEKDGYLAPALAVAPRFNREAAELKKQHNRLLETINDFINRLKDCECPFECWHDARDEFEAIVDELREHEHAENAIVQSAFGDDVGAAD